MAGFEAEPTGRLASFAGACSSAVSGIGSLSRIARRARFCTPSHLSGCLADQRGEGTAHHPSTRAHASGAQKVFLILPAEQGRHDTIKKSLEGRATLLPIRKLSTDNIHPTEKGYQDLANQVKKS